MPTEPNDFVSGLLEDGNRDKQTYVGIKFTFGLFPHGPGIRGDDEYWQ